ncbi:MAG: DUF924 family protein [Pseudomonadota bacterium]
MPEPVRATAILDYWLDEVGEKGWYLADPDRDAEIAHRFADDHAAACAGRLRDWLTAPRSALALLVLLDQFSRNLYRGSARAYQADPLALKIMVAAIRVGHDKQIAKPARQFFYLPLMHSERLADQERCVRLFLMDHPTEAENNLEHAIKHREVIRRFGRFPSRNAAMGRADSEAERAYRAADGYMS